MLGEGGLEWVSGMQEAGGLGCVGHSKLEWSGRWGLGCQAAKAALLPSSVILLPPSWIAALPS